jgi:trigger factor
MAEVLQTMIDETSRQAISERNERPAQQPSINLTEDKEEIERVLTGQSDLAFTMSYETLPKITVTDLSALKLERQVADVADEAIERAINQLVDRAVRYEVEADRNAGDADRVTIDFVGSIDGQEFEGGKGEGVELVIGQSTLSLASSKVLPVPRPARSARSTPNSRIPILSRHWPEKMRFLPSK